MNIHISRKKKACEVQFEKQNYLRHLNRLVRLRGGTSLQQMKRTQQQKKLAATINNMRKIHEQSRRFRRQQQNQQYQQTKQTNYNKIESVIKKQLQQQPSPTFFPSTRKTDTSLMQQNTRIYNRILNTKPCIKTKMKQNYQYFQSTSTYQLNNRQDTNRYGQCCKEKVDTQGLDFSSLYEASQLRARKKRVVKLKLGLRRREWVRGVLEFGVDDLRQFVQDLEGVYLLEIQCGNFVARTPHIYLNIDEEWQIRLKISGRAYRQHGISSKLIKIVECTKNRQIVKSEFMLEQKQEEERKRKESEKDRSEQKTSQKRVETEQNKEIQKQNKKKQGYKYKYIQLEMIKKNGKLSRDYKTQTEYTVVSSKMQNNTIPV